MTRILVADRDAESRKALAAMLAAGGYASDATPFGRVALAMAARKGYAAAIIGRRLSDMDGFRLMRLLAGRAANPDLKAIAVTPADEAAAPAMAQMLGAWDVISTPPVAVEVLFKVARAVDECVGTSGQSPLPLDGGELERG
jgi:DNA-binding response OmpR family regulator